MTVAIGAFLGLAPTLNIKLFLKMYIFYQKLHHFSFLKVNDFDTQQREYPAREIVAINFRSSSGSERSKGLLILL